MDKRKEILDSLNSLLQGEHMAIESYNILINHTQNQEVKDKFQEFQEDHRRHAALLAEHIQSLGDKPRERTGMKGFMADTMINLDLSVNDDLKHIIKKAFEGEHKGINKTEELVRGDLDEESRKLVGEILSEDRGHLEDMNNLLKRYS